MNGFEKVKQRLPSKEKFYSLLAGKKIVIKIYEHVIKVWNGFKMKIINNYHDRHLKCDVLC